MIYWRKWSIGGEIMGVSVAEYYGQRTDIDTPVIHPVKGQLPCPFYLWNTCKKLKSGNPPVCSVRKAAERYGLFALKDYAQQKKISLYANISVLFFTMLVSTFSSVRIQRTNLCEA